MVSAVVVGLLGNSQFTEAGRCVLIFIYYFIEKYCTNFPICFCGCKILRHFNFCGLLMMAFRAASR